MVSFPTDLCVRVSNQIEKNRVGLDESPTKRMRRTTMKEEEEKKKAALRDQSRGWRDDFEIFTNEKEELMGFRQTIDLSTDETTLPSPYVNVYVLVTVFILVSQRLISTPIVSVVSIDWQQEPRQRMYCLEKSTGGAAPPPRSTSLPSLLGSCFPPQCDVITNLRHVEPCPPRLCPP